MSYTETEVHKVFTQVRPFQDEGSIDFRETKIVGMTGVCVSFTLICGTFHTGLLFNGK